MIVAYKVGLWFCLFPSPVWLMVKSWFNSKIIIVIFSLYEIGWFRKKYLIHFCQMGLLKKFSRMKRMGPSPSGGCGPACLDCGSHLITMRELNRTQYERAELWEESESLWHFLNPWAHLGAFLPWDFSSSETIYFFIVLSNWVRVLCYLYSDHSNQHRPHDFLQKMPLNCKTLRGL